MELWFHKKAFWNFLLLVRVAPWEQPSLCVLAAVGRNREAEWCAELKNNIKSVKWYFTNLKIFCLGSFQIWAQNHGAGSPSVHREGCASYSGEICNPLFHLFPLLFPTTVIWTVLSFFSFFPSKIPVFPSPFRTSLSVFKETCVEPSHEVGVRSRLTPYFILYFHGMNQGQHWPLR